MRKKLAILLVFMLLTATFIPVPALAADRDFPDVGNHWAKKYINALSATSYVNGYPDGTFKPDKTVSQAEFLTVLILCMGLSPTDTTTEYFSDTSNHWALKYINEAAKQGILIPSEYSNVLQPDTGLKRSQLAAMAVRALGRQPDNGPLSFTDNAIVEQSDYRGYIKTAYDLGLLSGYDTGEFKPFEYVTRAQMCKVLCDFMEVNAGQSEETNNIPSGPIKYIAIGDELYNYADVPLYFKVNYDNIRITSISTNSEYITVNGDYRFFLDSTINNPEIVVNNIRYGISKLLINGDKLVIYPSFRKIDSFTQGNNKYFADYVKLYINSANTNKYLSDMEIIDELKVKIGNTTYDLNKNQITIEINSNFYNIIKINLGATETSLQTAATDPIVIKGINIDDISAIFAEDKLLELKNIKTIEFIIEGERYRLSQVTVDVAGNFIVNKNTYSPNDIDMIVDDKYYEIDHFRIYKDKYIFYCTTSVQKDLVRLNNIYVDADKIRILKDNETYNLNQIVVVKRNIIRIQNREYKINSSFKCLYNNDVYDIDRIDYNSSRDCIEIRGDETRDNYWANQPSKYVFYVDDEKYQDGATKETSIYVDRQWLNFDEIMISDPAHFTYDGESYDLIGAIIRIDRADFEVTDTSWRGQTRVMNLYLEEL